MNGYQMSQVQESINARQAELHSVTDTLALAAQRASLRASVAKVVLVLLGAFAATREAANQLFGANSELIVIVYTLGALSIAVVAGLEAAFKWETRSVELRILAASGQSTTRLVDTQWRKEVGTVSASPEEQLAAARRLLDVQDTKLAEIQERAATLGVNITLEVRELLRGQDLYPA
jgi:hypothetical protein